MTIQLQVNNTGPIILVDGSYFIFHRFYATLKWYKFRNKEVDSATCMNIDEFREAIIKHTLADLTKLRKNWALPSDGKKRVSKKDWESIPIWFGVDCHRVNIWRSKIITDYKGTRDRTSTREALDTRCFEILYELLKTQQYNEKEMPLMEVDELEADDVIALTHKKLRTNGYTGKIVCITNDNDYLQLRDENTEIYNLDDKNLLTRSCGCPKKDLLIKILTGDKSDNIQAVRGKLTDKKLKDLLHLTDEEILGSLDLNEIEMERFELNKKLIDFACIPLEFIEKYNTSYEIQINH